MRGQAVDISRFALRIGHFSMGKDPSRKGLNWSLGERDLRPSCMGREDLHVCKE